MITLVIVKNPFSPRDGREVKYIEFDGTLADLKEQNKMPGVDLMATVNGYSVEDDTVIKDDDFVVIYPAIEKGGGGKGKSILGIVAAIALSVVAMGVGGLVATGVWGSFAGATSLMATAGYMTAMAIMFLGSSLISRMSGQKVDQGSYTNSEATYSWSGVQTMEGQNNPIALTYGTVKSGGQTIGKYTMASGNDDYLYWLVACGEGELEINDIQLNNNAISMYKGVTYQVRNGTNDQAIIDFFGDTHFTTPLSYNMSQDTWYTSSVQGASTEGIIVRIELPSGLFYTNSKGNYITNYVGIQIQVQDVTNNSSWTDYQSFSGADMSSFDYTLNALKISGASTKAIRRDFRIDRLPASEYAVRVKLSAVCYTNTQYGVYTTYWSGVSSIVYDDFIYPCTALIGIKALATDQLSGSPSLTFLKTRSIVYVWNPNTNEYESKLANNPAWACYDLIHQCRLLKNINNNKREFEVRGCPKELMRYEDFKNWADYCDEQNYYVNIEIVTAGEMLDVANDRIAPIGHGRVVRFGTKYGCIYAHPQDAVQMYGMGNIISGSFHEEFMKVNDRANSVEITFTNAMAGYERDVLTIYGDTFDSDGYSKTAQMTMDGITSFSQAYREGVYQLQCNKLQLRTISFEASIDAIACTVGDVIILAHDVPMWQYSGRVQSVTGNQILLPCSVADPEAEYILQWRDTDTDTLHEHGCTVVDAETDGWVTVEMTYEQGEEAIYPQANEIFSIAESTTENKLFTVQSITRSQDFTRTINCVEYNEDVFDEPENYDGDEEKQRIFHVSIQQMPNQTVTVRKYKGNVSLSYTSSFTEEETGWYIEINIDGDAGYAPGKMYVNGMAYASGVDFPLNTNYNISATASASGQTTYIDGTTDNIFGTASFRWFVMYTDHNCTQSINRSELYGRLRCIDVNGNLQYGDAIFGVHESGSAGVGLCNHVTEIDQYIDTSGMTTLAWCFNRCSELQNVNLTDWDTGNCTTFRWMFYGCHNLLHVGDISHWDTTYITTTHRMFYECYLLQSIDLSGWNTPRLSICTEMFRYCSALVSVDISGFDTTNITNADDMFRNCSNLQYIIMDAHEIKFGGDVVLADANNTVKYLVPADMVTSYQEHANWSARADRIDSISNYNIIRSNGHVTVVPKG